MLFFLSGSANQRFKMYQNPLISSFSLIAVGCLLLMIFGLFSAVSGVEAGSRKITDKQAYSVSVPEKWSVAPGELTNAHQLIRVRPEMLKKAIGGPRVPRLMIFKEQRMSHDDALQRLKEIDAEQETQAEFVEINGWPALIRRYMAPMEQPGRPQVELEESLRITIAIAVDDLLVRVQGTLPPDADPKLADEMEEIARQLVFVKKGEPQKAEEEIRRLKDAPRLGPTIPSGAIKDPDTLAGEAEPDPSMKDEASVGLTQMVQGGAGVDSEIEISASTDGRHIVVVNNGRDFATSNDGGVTFSTTGIVPAVTGGGGNGDPSVSFGASGNFYFGFIGFPPFPPGTPPLPPPPVNPRVCSTGIATSTNNGQAFNFTANATQCDDVNGPACFPDQEHIAADRFNLSTTGQDQIYSTWRNFSGGGCNGNGFGASGPVITSLVCSSDNGANWSATTVVDAGGDYPRLTVGQDGFVYVIYRSGNNLMVNKFSSCDTGLAPQAGFPRTIVAGITRVTCPATPGIDRCNNGSDLTSHMVAVDDTNPNHIYAAYAVSTNPGVNENVLVQDSIDGGQTWPGARTVQVNNGVVGRRFMPWVCSAGGRAYVSWYDLRFSSGVQNDLADYFGASAGIDTTGDLSAGSEFRITKVSDPLCASGWPCGARAAANSESCSAQPQLAGFCTTPAGVQTGARCDFSDCGGAGSGVGAACQCNIAAGETCNLGGGCPKYGDYSGNACAAGRFYTAWASATSPPEISPPSSSIDVFFERRVVCCVPQVQMPSDLDMGDACIGRTKTSTLNICNTGKEDLVVEPITSSNPQFTVATPSSGFPVVISHDFCFPFQVEYTPAGSGAANGTLTVQTNDSVNPFTDVEVSGIGVECATLIQVPGRVDLGESCVGIPRTGTLNVCNTGIDDLIVDPITSSGPQFTVMTPSSGFPVVISHDFCFPFEVEFIPSGEGPQTGQLTIPSNDPSHPATDVAVSGIGAAPDIRVSGSTDFGVTSAWSPAEKRVSVCNAGNCDLSVTSTNIDCLDFTLQDNPFPANLEPGSCLELVVEFSPQLPGKKTCQLAIASNDPDSPVVNRVLTAKTPPALSLHAGLVDPHSALGSVAGNGSTINLDFIYPLGPNLSWDLRLGFSRFDGHSGNPDTELWSLGVNAKYTFNPSQPLRLFLNGGADLYHFDFIERTLFLYQ